MRAGGRQQHGAPWNQHRHIIRLERDRLGHLLEAALEQLHPTLGIAGLEASSGPEQQSRAVPDQRFGMLGVFGEHSLARLHRLLQPRLVATEAGEEICADHEIEALGLQRYRESNDRQHERNKQRDDRHVVTPFTLTVEPHAPRSGRFPTNGEFSRMKGCIGRRRLDPRSTVFFHLRWGPTRAFTLMPCRPTASAGLPGAARPTLSTLGLAAPRMARRRYLTTMSVCPFGM